MIITYCINISIIFFIHSHYTTYFSKNNLNLIHFPAQTLNIHKMFLKSPKNILRIQNIFQNILNICGKRNIQMSVKNLHVITYSENVPYMYIPQNFNFFKNSRSGQAVNQFLNKILL